MGSNSGFVKCFPQVLDHFQTLTLDSLICRMEVMLLSRARYTVSGSLGPRVQYRAWYQTRPLVTLNSRYGLNVKGPHIRQ